MIYIKHRLNKISDLNNLPKSYGCEIDLRSDISRQKKIYLSHDPWTLGDDFDLWLEEYSRLKIQGPLILNTKEDGLEKTILEKLEKFSINNFFFLDTTVPTLIKFYKERRVKNFAIRVSHYEDTILAEQLRGFANWLWIDCFHGEAFDEKKLIGLKKDYQICLVSPELQGFELKMNFKKFFQLSYLADAVCTKDPEFWSWLKKNFNKGYTSK